MNRLNFVSEGTRQFFRGRFRTFASIVILVSSLLLVGVFATVMIVINKSVENIDDFNKIVVYMKLDTQNEQVNAAKKQIESLKKTIFQIKFTRATAPVANPVEARIARRKIALIKTILRQRELEAGSNAENK